MSLIYIAMVHSLLLGAALSQGTCKETSDVKLTFYGMAEGGDTTAFACGNNGGVAGGAFSLHSYYKSSKIRRLTGSKVPVHTPTPRLLRPQEAIPLSPNARLCTYRI